MIISRPCDIVKKPTILCIFFCAIFILYHFIFYNNPYKCQTHSVNKSDTNKTRHLFQETDTIISEKSIYSTANSNVIEANTLKQIAKNYQQTVDRKRYGSFKDRCQNVRQYCDQHLDNDTYWSFLKNSHF